MNIKSKLRVLPGFRHISRLKQVIVNARHKRINAERRICNPAGHPSDRSVYIIRRHHQAGFFSNFFYVLGHIIYADQNGWDIAVDMENYPTLYNETSSVDGTKNAWEYYFAQPCRISLQEAYGRRDQVLSSGYYMYDLVPYYEGTNRVFPTRDIVDKLQPYLTKYFHVKESILQDAMAIRSQWEGSVVGVHIRGTDMHVTPNHPIPPLLSQYYTAIDSLLAKGNVQHICLCTDENSILTQMQQRYGEKVVFTNSYRSADGKSIHKDHHDEQRSNHRYLMGREVLIDALVLSKCEHLVCGHSNVPYAALVMNSNRYETVSLLEHKDQDVNMTH